MGTAKQVLFVLEKVMLVLMHLIKEGAEARLYKTSYLGKTVLVKERIPKNYRNKILDERIRKERIRIEARALSQAKSLGIRTPIIYGIRKTSLILEFIPGPTLKKALQESKSKATALKKLRQVGRIIALMHENDLIHGDLTTSNIILGKNSLFFIDFGLSKKSQLVEEKAMDLVVFEKTFQATHSEMPEGWQEILEGYKEKNSSAKEVFERMKEIKERARYL